MPIKITIDIIKSLASYRAATVRGVRVSVLSEMSKVSPKFFKNQSEYFIGSSIILIKDGGFQWMVIHKN